MASGVSESSVYRRIPSRMKKEASTHLGMEEPNEDPERFVEAYLESVIGQNQLGAEEMGLLRVQTTLLDPSLKPPRLSHPHRRVKRLSSREKKALKLHEVPKGQQNYSLFLPLHDLWVKYITDLLQLNTEKHTNHSQLSQKMLKADYHGCLLRVCKSKCPSYVGAEGIVLQETQNTFKLIGKNNRIKTIPKAHSVFSFELKGLLFHLHGNHMKFKSSERSAKKFKDKSTIDL